METYEVVWGPRRGRKFDNLQDAVIFAREKAVDATGGTVVPVWSNCLGVVVAVVTDDANGLMVHRLATWPDGVECAYL